MARWADSDFDSAEQLRRKRKAIVREAAKVFNRRGFHGATLDDVAERLSITKAALYRYVANKNELLCACHEEAMEIANNAMDRGERKGRNGLEKIRIGMRSYLETMIGEMGVPVLILEENALTGEEAVRVIKLRDDFETRMRRLVIEGMEDGSILRLNPKMATFMVLGAVHWVTKWYSPGGAWTASEVADALIEMVTRGMASKPSAELESQIHRNVIEMAGGKPRRN